jgi:ubiquinone/menaquinone biosynthesis C-methylase UbiE
MNRSLFRILFLFSLLFLGQLKAYEPSYALVQGWEDQERLSILNDLYNPSSLPLLSLSPGMRVLTIGCGTGILELEIAKKIGSTGTVLATDVSSEQLKIAEKNCQNKAVHNLKFLQMNVFDIDQILGSFDRIHCRFVLSHLPWEKVMQILPILYSKLTPGGLLVLEEIATLESLACHPCDPGYDKWKECIQKQFVLQKSDPSAGKKIYQYLSDEGYEVSYFSHQPSLVTQREKTILSLGVGSVSKKLLENQLISEEEIEEMLLLLHELEQNIAKTPSYCEVSQMVICCP